MQFTARNIHFSYTNLNTNHWQIITMKICLVLGIACAVLIALEHTPSSTADPIVPLVVNGARAASVGVKQVFHRYATRKAAKEAAQRASNGMKPVSHGAHKPGYSPHYHQTGKNGKPTDYTIKHDSYRVHEHFQFPKNKG